MILVGGAALYCLGKRYIYVDDAVGLVVGSLIGSVIDPDLRDMHNITTRSERRVWALPIIGPVAGLLWETYWYPMARVIPHRSIWSHLPVLATAVAALYLFLPLSALLYLLFVSTGGLVGFLPWLLGLLQGWMVFVFIGWCVQDTIHFIQDGGRLNYPEWVYRLFGRKPKRPSKRRYAGKRQWSSTL